MSFMISLWSWKRVFEMIFAHSFKTFRHNCPLSVTYYHLQTVVPHPPSFVSTDRVPKASFVAFILLCELKLLLCFVFSLLTILLQILAICWKTSLVVISIFHFLCRPLSILISVDSSLFRWAIFCSEQKIHWMIHLWERLWYVPSQRVNTLNILKWPYEKVMNHYMALSFIKNTESKSKREIDCISICSKSYRWNYF